MLQTPLSNKQAVIYLQLEGLPNVKDEVYGALDLWCAFELDFPLLALKRALSLLHQQQQNKRIIQVCKWMLSKGQGRTLGTYQMMLEAYDAEGRLVEAEEMWARIVEESKESVPRFLFARMMAMYSLREKHTDVLKVFFTMEELGIRPDEAMVKKAANAHTELGHPERAAAVVQRYPAIRWEWDYVKRRRIKVKTVLPTPANEEDGGEPADKEVATCENDALIGVDDVHDSVIVTPPQSAELEHIGVSGLLRADSNSISGKGATEGISTCPRTP
eukprot:SM000102S09177  [mRNA]  locus=s102:65971:67726:- [translate_table: standard]